MESFCRFRHCHSWKHYFQHFNQRGILSHVQNVFFISSKNNTLNIRMNKVEMLICLETFHPPPFPIHTLNTWRKIASWVIFAIYNPSTLQNKTFSIPRKLTCRVNFQIYPSRPYKENSWTVQLVSWICPHLCHDSVLPSYGHFWSGTPN